MMHLLPMRGCYREVHLLSASVSLVCLFALFLHHSSSLGLDL